MNLFDKVIAFIFSFDAWNYMISNQMIFVYTGVFIFSLFCILEYPSFIYGLKKSDKAKQYIKKQYTVFQRVLLIHMAENLYKKIDPSWFRFTRCIYLINLILFVSIIFITILCRFIPLFNLFCAVLFFSHCILMILIIIGCLLSSKRTRDQQWEARYAKKYDRKNW